MIDLKKILTVADPRDIRVREAFKDKPDIYRAIKNYRDEIITLWDVLYYGECAFNNFLSCHGVEQVKDKLASYGLQFNDLIVSNHSFFDYALIHRLYEVGFDALDECSIIDFLQGSKAMEFINQTVTKYINDSVVSQKNNATSKDELAVIEKRVDYMLTDYKIKVNEKRLELSKLITPEGEVELEKKRAGDRMATKLAEMKHFHHTPNNNSHEYSHKHNPFSVEDTLL